MAGQRSAKKSQSESRVSDFDTRLANAYKEIWAAYCNAIRDTACKQAQAGRGMHVSSTTAANYEHQITPVNVARVLAYPKLRKAFKRAFCGEHHDPVPAPYIARKRSRK